MQVKRQWTKAGQSPFETIPFKTVSIEICHADPQQRLCIPDFEVPAGWSYEAAEYLARHYLRKTGVPVRTCRVEESTVPSWLWRSKADVEALDALPSAERYGGEVSVRQIFHRLAGAWAYWGWSQGYFDTEEDVGAFYDECCYAMAMQMAAPASPHWLNTGLHWAYGIEGEAQGHFYVDAQTGSICESRNAYERPQHHHCFIQGVKDELVSDGGIMDLWEREARVFKHGSGSGSNLSAIRGATETLSGGTMSVGLMRFLAMGEQAAGAIKSGGNDRPVEKLVIVDIDHPEIESFLRWRVQEEHKVAALVAGSRHMRLHLQRIMTAVQQWREEYQDENDAGACFDVNRNLALQEAMALAQQANIPQGHVLRVIDYLRQGFDQIDLPIYGSGEEPDVSLLISPMQMQMAVRVPDQFMQATQTDDMWALRNRKDDRGSSRVPASQLMETVAQACWAGGAPSVQFHDTIQFWHGCVQDGAIQASSPGGEFLFLDDTACDVATLNIARFIGLDGQFQLASFEHASRLMTLMLDIATAMAQYPSRMTARNTYRYRPIGLSHCNLSAAVMCMGYAYDSEEARSIGAAITAVMTGVAYVTSAELARELGAFDAFSKHRDGMLRLLWKHHEAAFGRTEHLATLNVSPYVLDHASLPDSTLADAVQRIWDMAMVRGDEYGYSNAQVSLIAASPNIGRLMDVVATSVQSVEKLVVYRRHVDGKVRKSLRKEVLQALRVLDYSAAQIAQIEYYMLGARSLRHASDIHHQALYAKGFSDAQIERIEEALGQATHLREAFDPFVIGERFCREILGLQDSHIYDADFDLLAHLGFSAGQISRANEYACGADNLHRAPHIREEDLAIFEPASDEAQIYMMAALQPFVSGGIAHPITLPAKSSITECAQWLELAWKIGLKSIAIQREKVAICSDNIIEQAENSSKHVPQASLYKEPSAETMARMDGGYRYTTEGLMERMALWQGKIERMGDVRYDKKSVTGFVQRVLDENIPPPLESVSADEELSFSTQQEIPRTVIHHPAIRVAVLGTPLPLTRRELPTRRSGFTQKAKVGGQTVYVRTGEYHDHRLGEVFIDMPDQLPAYRALMNQLAMALSVSLQHGVPLQAFVDLFRKSQFEPAGAVEGSEVVDTATSVLDYIMRELSQAYLAGEEAVDTSGLPFQLMEWLHQSKDQMDAEDKLSTLSVADDAETV